MPDWPFQRGRSAWISGNRITRAIAELWDDQLSNAADGRVYSDVAQAQNWFVSTSGPVTLTKSCAWDPTRGYWFVAGDNGTDSTGSVVYRSGDYGSSFTISTNLTIGNEAAVIAPNGAWVVGGNPAGSSAAKIRYSTDAGVNWTSVNTVVAGTSAVSVLHTFAAAGLIIAGLDNGDIETSPTGAVWTARTEPNANPRNNAASSSTICVVTSTSSTNKVITSPDGVTWTERTLPSSGVWSVAWNALDHVFLAINASTAAKSTDGITWTDVGVTAPGGTQLCCIGHVFVAYATATTGVVYTSVDMGANWRSAAAFSAAPTVYCMREGDHQLLAVESGGSVGKRIYRTLALGGR
jgi:hypothetical protein